MTQPLDYSRYKKGQQDEAGEKILTIYIKTKKYVIYDKIKKGNICFMISGSDIPVNFSDISSNLDKVNRHLSNNSITKTFCKRISHVYMCALDGKIDAANNILCDLEASITKHKDAIGRLNYLLTCLLFVVINIAIGLFVHYKKSLVNDRLITDFIYSAMFGSFGGFLSIAFNIKKIDIDTDINWTSNVLNAFTRIFYGMLAGVIIYVLIKSKIFLNILDETSSSNSYAIYAVATIAGFIENYLPNMLKNWSK